MCIVTVNSALVCLQLSVSVKNQHACTCACSLLEFLPVLILLLQGTTTPVPTPEVRHLAKYFAHLSNLEQSCTSIIGRDVDTTGKCLITWYFAAWLPMHWLFWMRLKDNRKWHLIRWFWLFFVPWLSCMPLVDCSTKCQTNYSHFHWVQHWARLWWAAGLPVWHCSVWYKGVDCLTDRHILQPTDSHINYWIHEVGVYYRWECNSTWVHVNMDFQYNPCNPSTNTSTSTNTFSTRWYHLAKCELFRQCDYSLSLSAFPLMHLSSTFCNTATTKAGIFTCYAWKDWIYIHMHISGSLQDLGSAAPVQLMHLAYDLACHHWRAKAWPWMGIIWGSRTPHGEGTLWNLAVCGRIHVWLIPIISLLFCVWWGACHLPSMGLCWGSRCRDIMLVMSYERFFLWSWINWLVVRMIIVTSHLGWRTLVLSVCMRTNLVTEPDTVWQGNQGCVENYAGSHLWHITLKNKVCHLWCLVFAYP